MANAENIVDYAPHMTKIEKLMREMHDACLERQYSKAIDVCTAITVESRVLSATLAIMESKERHK